MKCKFMNEKLKIEKNKSIIILLSLLLMGFLVRIINIQNIPNAVNIDEASSGYEALSILTNGIDRNGKSFPVFLISWGSGQNALYTYLLIPFIKIMGLSVLSTRLPMAIIGCISLIVMYKLLKKIKSEKVALIGTAFLAIGPWHIMKSRWGLESNLLPDIVLWAVYFFVVYLDNKKSRNLYFTSILLGISAYAYGTAYFFLPIFYIGCLIFLLIKKEVNIKQTIISAICLGIIVLPIMLYVIINYFDLQEIKILCFTIPKTTSINRFETESSIFSGNFILNSLKNFCGSIKMLILQKDDAPWNAISGFGITYIFSLPFFIDGIIKEIKLNDSKSFIWKMWLIAAIALLFVSVVNINKMNIIIFPIIYYTIIGICDIINKYKKCKVYIYIAYIISFIFFIIVYCNIDSSKYYTFSNGIEEVISYIENSENVEKVYFPYTIKEPYIYVLFYSKMDSNEFINTRVLKSETGSFENILACGKYIFYKNDLNFEEKNENIYIVNSNQEINVDETKWKIVNFDRYKIIRYMGENVNEN